MLNQMYSEWVKLRSVRSTVVMFILAIGLTVIVAGLSQIAAVEDAVIDQVFVGVAISQIFFLVLGVQIIGQEYRFKTIRITFAATPNRFKVIYAKLIVLILSVGLSTLILMLLSIGVAQMVLAIEGHSIDFGYDYTQQIIIAYFFTSIFYSVFGFGVGSIIKQPIAGIVLSLIWVFVVESIIFAILRYVIESDLYKWLPFTAVGNLMYEYQSGAYDDILDEFAVFSTQSIYIYLTIFSIVLVGAGAVLINRRDA